LIECGCFKIESSLKGAVPFVSVVAELHKSDDAFKSELRSKEAEIAALRDGILSRRMQRQALLDKRRMEAVEKV
jgi:hypothetical protein